MLSHIIDNIMLGDKILEDKAWDVNKTYSYYSN